jgi:preprotein translocase subunit SecA
MSILTKIFGTKFDRDRKKLQPLVDEINRREAEYRNLSEEAFRSLSAGFRERLARKIAEPTAALASVRSRLASELTTGEEDELKAEEKDLIKTIRAAEKAELEVLLPDAFAAVKNACRRLLKQTWDVCGQSLTWEMVPFDVQIIGGIALHQGRIAEMATGEGKTLVATFPLYLNALAGHGVHLVTVNDYLARRDREWMGRIFESLGLSVGCIQVGMEPAERCAAYACDITYGTNNEFGFDYLRDNMAVRPEDQVQRIYLHHKADTDEIKRGHYYAIIDEADSILIDEARTPLIISGPVARDESTHLVYKRVMPLMKDLSRRQALLCARLLAEGKAAWEKDDEETAARRFYQVKKGQPKNKQLMSLIEDPAARRLIERAEVELDAVSSQAPRAEEGRAMREELFYTLNERAHEINITDKGHLALSPQNPDEYVVESQQQDWLSEHQKVESDPLLSREEKVLRHNEIVREEQAFNQKIDKIHAAFTSLRALDLFEKDVEYVIQDNKVVIVDEFTGRLMPGRRYSDGLHQALEAKEGVWIEHETQTLATVTIQNYFRMYEKLAGMTGTAETEAVEFDKIYHLDVMVIPTNEPVRRTNYHDRIYKTKNEKYQAVIAEIAAGFEKQRPVLVGTVSVDTSEVLSRMLKRRKIPHQVLNARYHQQEAEIVTRAGQAGAVTIATNMAGRGTDIKLGAGVVRAECLETRGRNRRAAGEAFAGEPWCCVTCRVYDKCRRGSKALCGKPAQMFACRSEVPCGLHIVGTERHEARRIDRQLRGRCARQGDPGASRFYLSLEDDLMRLFGSDRIAGIMGKMGIEEGEEMTHPLLTRAIETAQKRVEGHNFSIREHILKYDDVMNKQREEIYAFRTSIIDSLNPRRGILGVIEEAVREKVEEFCPEKTPPEEWKWSRLSLWLQSTFLISLPEKSPPEGIAAAGLTEKIMGQVSRFYELKEVYEGKENMRRLEKLVVLSVIDRLWLEHLANMDDLRQGISLRAYGQRDPLVDYKQESYEMFTNMEANLKQEVAGAIFRASIRPPPLTRAPERFIHEEVAAFSGRLPAKPQARPRPAPAAAMAGGDPGELFPGAPPAESAPSAPVTFKREAAKTGPNDPCPCGSGKKFKKCCGKQ